VKGREAVTEYHTIRNFLQHTLLSVHPLTGRTHQIRVHMAFMGCPVAGDTVYGKRKPTIDICRQFLHAHKIRINLPGESQASAFEAPLPSELEEILKILD
jgi:23S rRNA pseudouridine1911/1915/1917 synthase